MGGPRQYFPPESLNTFRKYYESWHNCASRVQIGIGNLIQTVFVFKLSHRCPLDFQIGSQNSLRGVVTRVQKQLLVVPVIQP
jgi:hypothetical protein